MLKMPWHGPHWPEGVDRELSGFEKPVISILDEAARQFPDRVYTIFNGGVRTFAQVRETADRIADFLAGRGIGPGDRVAIVLPNLPHYPAIFFGILKAGAACVTCNPLYTPSELHFQLSDSGARAVFCMDHPKFYPATVKAIEQTAVENVVICNVKSFLPPIQGFLGGILGRIPKAGKYEPGHIRFEGAVRDARPRPPAVDIDPERDPALVLYTGGTTGTPKGAVLTHANIVVNNMILEEWLRIPRKPNSPPQKILKGGVHCFLGVLPWYHSFGITCCLLASCSTANRLVCVPDPRAGNPPFTDVLKAIRKYKATLMPAVPALLSAFTDHPLLEKYDLTSLEACFSGGDTLPDKVARSFEDKTGAIVFEGYGLSEAAPLVTANPLDIEHRKFGTIGLPLPGTDIKVVDLVTGYQEMPRGRDGELAVHGPQIMREYWGQPEESAAVFRELDGKRYFLTGDIGHMDEEGFFVLSDRKKDMILVGGFNVYPRDVEEVLYQHPDVALAAVVGLPNGQKGELVKAFIQLKPGKAADKEEIQDFCRERLAGYKRPRQVEFRESVPLSPVGKVLRRALREDGPNNAGREL